MNTGNGSQRGSKRSSSESRTNVFVKFSGSIDNLLRLGLEAPTVVEDPTDGLYIAAGSIPTDKLEELAREPNVTRVEPSHRLRVKLNTSVAAIHADTLRQRTPPVNGNGVLIGIVDTGVDYRHRNFRTGANSADSRILRIWDQSLDPPQAGETRPAGFNFGVEYTQAQIKTALQNTTPRNPGTPATRAPFDLVRSGEPPEGNNSGSTHGTHVAGIAAGNGIEPGQCSPLSTFTGVAPQAELIVVVPESEDDPDYDAGGSVQLFDSVHLANAVQYVFQVASDPNVGQGRPAVVNISLGTEVGPHNGDTLLESLLDAVVTQNVNGQIVGRPGRAIVVAAGNEADDALHATVDIAPGATETIVFRVPDVPANKIVPASLRPQIGGYRRAERIDIYHDGGTAIEVSITPPGTPSRTFGPVREGNTGGPYELNNSTDPQLRSRLRITSTINHIQIHLLHPTPAELGAPLRKNRGRFPAGPWQIRLKSNAVTDSVTAHCWLEGHPRPMKQGDAEVSERPPEIPYWHLSFRFPGETGLLASLLTPSDENWTVASPGSAKQVITVGAYSHPRGSGTELEIARFSSRGRLLTGVNPVPDGAQKPDIVAPGVEINSTKSGAIDDATKAFAFRWCSRCCYDFYVQKQGTSMAAPHVTGVVALMFQANPSLDALTVRQILRETADEPDLTPPLVFPNNIWGYGIVNAADAVDRAIELRSAGSRAAAGAASASSSNAASRVSPSVAARGGLQARRARPRMRRSSRLPSDGLIPAEFLRSLRLPESSLTTLLVSRHFSEVRRLIDTNPRIATLWHRCRGPSVVRRTLGALQDGFNDLTPSSGTRDATRQERRWRAFFAAVSEQSGVGLREDLERFGPHLLALLRAAEPTRSRATSAAGIPGE